MNDHPLHLAVAHAVNASLSGGGDAWLCDPACGGSQHLPIFVGNERNRQSRLCCVDMLLIRDSAVRAIVEIEESGFLPTKVCGKYLQTAMCRNLLHRSLPDGRAAFADVVAFMHVLDGTPLKQRSSKSNQATVMQSAIRDLLPRIGGITNYTLLHVNGADDAIGIEEVVRRLRDVLA